MLSRLSPVCMKRYISFARHETWKMSKCLNRQYFSGNNLPPKQLNNNTCKIKEEKLYLLIFINAMHKIQMNPKSKSNSMQFLCYFLIVTSPCPIVVAGARPCPGPCPKQKLVPARVPFYFWSWPWAPSPSNYSSSPIYCFFIVFLY